MIISMTFIFNQNGNWKTISQVHHLTHQVSLFEVNIGMERSYLTNMIWNPSRCTMTLELFVLIFLNT